MPRFRQGVFNNASFRQVPAVLEPFRTELNSEKRTEFALVSRDLAQTIKLARGLL
jgi:hypothetical protein